MHDDYRDAFLLPHNSRFSAADIFLVVLGGRCVRHGVKSRGRHEYHQHYLDAVTSILEILPDAIMIDLTKDRI